MYLIDLIKYYASAMVDKLSNGLINRQSKTFFMSDKSRGVGGKNATPVLPSHPSPIQPKPLSAYSGYSGVDPTEDDDKYVWYCQMMRSRRLTPMTHAKYTQWQESLSALYRDSDGCPVTKVADQMTSRMMQHAKENHYASKER